MAEIEIPKLSKHDALVLAWKKRSDYKGYDRTKGSAFNSWRSIVGTAHGKEIGFPEEWKRDFEAFKRDVEGEWARGKICLRKDKKKPYSKENCFWGEKGTEVLGKLTVFEYNGESKTLLEWARDLNINYTGLRQRFYKHKDWCKEWILFGKPVMRRKVDRDKEYTFRTSRLFHSYKLRDKQRGLTNDLTKEFVLDLCKKPCIYCGDTKRIGLDRKDNSIGHTKDNVVPCCYDCNCARNNNFTHEEMLIIGKAIKKIKQIRNKKKITD